MGQHWNMRMDPYEPADVTSNSLFQWKVLVDQVVRKSLPWTVTAQITNTSKVMTSSAQTG